MSTTLTCPNGHASTESDYCSVCGTLMAPAAAPPVDDGPTFIPRPKPPVEACPNCSSELDPASKFCEVCGYDPTTGSLPKPPVVSPADLDADDASATADPATGTWVVVVAADRAYYDRNQVAEVQFPLGVPPRVIELPTAGDPVAIGRRSASRGTSPGIDLAGPPEDAAVSHTHASLLPSDGGDGWSLVDHGSTNGTYVNETTNAVPANIPLPLKAGDRIYLGAWTKLTLELHPDQPN